MAVTSTSWVATKRPNNRAVMPVVAPPVVGSRTRLRLPTKLPLWRSWFASDAVRGGGARTLSHLQEHLGSSDAGSVRVLLLVLPGVALTVSGSLLCAYFPAISKRRNLRRAQEAGARWAGFAQFDGSEKGQAPVVEHALSGMGQLYGSLLTWGGRGPMPVAGLLYVFGDRLRWEPRIWLGRGKAKPWDLSLAEFRALNIARVPHVLRSYDATIVTDQGTVHFLTVDSDGLRHVLGS